MDVPQIILHHLAIAVERELARLDEIESLAEEERPHDFDANDIPLFRICLDAVRLAIARGESRVDLSGKPLTFLLSLIPGYLQDCSGSLSDEERQALGKLSLQPLSSV